MAKFVTAKATARDGQKILNGRPECPQNVYTKHNLLPLSSIHLSFSILPNRFLGLKQKKKTFPSWQIASSVFFLTNSKNIYSVLAMDIRTIVIMTLAAVSCCSCHPRTGNGLGLHHESNHGNHSAPQSHCVAVARQDFHSILRMRIRNFRGEVSVSPQSATPPYAKPDNSTKTNTTLPSQNPSSKIPYWFPAFENVVTPIFRTVILILTIFNVNITWRLHGQCPTAPCCRLGLAQN